MKKFLTLTVLIMTVTLSVASCGGSKGGHCDAYSNVDNNVQNTDLASK